MLKTQFARFAPAAMLSIAAAAAGLATFAEDAAAPTSEAPRVEPAAVERTRDTVKMLDDVYKSAIVLITDKYVHAEDDFAAGSAAVAWFGAINEKGWHTVRIIDATGDPYDPENVAESAFEKEAVRKLKAGESFVEKVVEKNGKPYLLAATPVPVVLERCIMCHPHYENAAEGEAIGALTYEMPIR